MNRFDEWQEFLRSAELEEATRFLPENADVRILEIGGRDGYQAKHISDMGFRNIVSIDVEPIFPQYFPVAETTGSELNFGSEAFDLIFTSHVVAHIENVDKSLREMRRVTTNDASFIHIVPTTSWSIITNGIHYVRLLFILPVRLIRRIGSIIKRQRIPVQEPERDSEVAVSGRIRREGLKYMLLNPLGENPSFVHEFYLFSQRGWTRLFSRNGYQVTNVTYGPYMYSGYGVLSQRFLALRRFLGRLGFSGSRCFVLKKST